MEISLRDFKLRFRRVYGVIDERFDDLLEICANEILNSVDSLEHVECDKSSFEVLRELGDGYFIRPFALQNSENDLLDFKDSNLISALFYKCAAHTSTEGLSEFEKEYFKQINSYTFRHKNESMSNVKEYLEKNKAGIPYKFSELNTSEFYIWDKGFLDNLDFYLADERANNAYKYRRFVLLFKEFQNGLNARADMKDLDKKMSEKLKGALNGRGKLYWDL